MKQIVFTLLTIFAAHSVFSQRGKDGAVTISATSTVNAYTALSANAAAGSTTLAVSSAAAFSAGDLIYIIQMQGATVNCYINIFGNQNSPEPYNSTFGQITNYNNAGNNEYAQVSSVSGTVITIDCALKNSYTAAGKVQVIRVPRYSSLNVTGTITCPAWNGTTGGVIAIEVEGNTTIGLNGRIDASAKGFRGGIVIGKNTGSTGGGSWGHNNPIEGGYKGESIAGDVMTYSVNFQGLYCKGAVANGGGGGNMNNCGGGGGANGGDPALYTGTGNPDASTANYVTAWNLESAGFATSSSSGGGRGGYAFSDANLSPLTNGPNLVSWNGDSRRNQGGLGGRPLDYSGGRIYCGGGGGAGDENDTYAGAGGRGGGIVNLVCYGNVSGTGQILADGENGFNTNAPSISFVLTGRDGAGGGGGGGAVFVNTPGTLTGIAISAKGGNGGNQQMRNGGASTNNSYGPGGGGGGGYIATTPTGITTNVSGGNNGIVIFLAGLNGSQIDNLFPPNGATRGGSGTVTSTINPVVTITTTSQGTICANNSATVAAGSTGTATIQWYTLNSGGTLLGSGSVLTTSVLSAPGTYTLYAGYCPDGSYRVPAIITVTNAPNVSATSATVCAGQTATLTASGAATYTWSTGANTSSITVNPASTTVYTVSGSNGGCTANATTTVSVGAGGTLTVNSATICAGQNATLTASGASTYTWSTGSNSASITVTPSVNSVYTISATNGLCQLTNTANVSVTANPTVSVNSATICAGQNATLSASGAATYTWNTGANTSSITVNPASTTVYTISGSNGGCTSVASTTVTVGAGGTLTVNSATICAGQNATLTASGASTYTWSTGSNSASITVTPSVNSVYTISATNGLCQLTNTANVSVTANPTVSVNSATICAGQNATLSASGAASYSWNTGATSSSITPSPGSTSTYTVTGYNGLCSSANTASVIVTPTGTISVNSATVCAGQSATLTAGTASSYTWSNGSNTSSVVVSPSATSAYTVNAIIASCPVSNTATVSVTANPTVSVNNATVCSGQAATLTATGATTYLWNTSASTATIAVSPAATQVYTVTGTSNNCSNTRTATVTVNSNPTVAVNSATICSGSQATLTASGAGTYSWNTGGSSASIQAQPLTTTIYTVTGTTGNCSDQKTATITVNSNPTVSVNSATICSGSQATLSASGASTFTWNTGSTSSSITLQPSATTVYTVTGNSANCSDQKTATVTVINTPTVSVNSSTVCAGNSVTLTASGAASYSWNTGAVSGSIAVSPASTQVYSVTGFNSNCAGLATGTVQVLATPTLTLNSNSFNLCSGESATISALSSENTYTWSNGNNSAQIITGTAGSYTVSTSNNCGIAASIVTVNVSSGPPSFTVVPSSSVICSGQSVTLTAIGSSGTYTWNTAAVSNSIVVTTPTVYIATLANSCGTVSAQIDIGGNTAPAVNITASSSTLCSGGSVTLTANSSGNLLWAHNSQTTAAVTVTSTGVYTVTSSNECGSTVENYTVVNGPPPTITIVQSGALCSGQSVTLTANGADNYSWNTGDNTPQIIVSTDGTFTATGTNSCGVSNSAYSVSFQPLPQVSLTSSDYTICPSETATLTANGINSTTYIWETFPTNPTNTQTVSSSGIYTVVVINGCGSDTAIISIAESTVQSNFNFTPSSGLAPLNVSFTNASVNNSTNQWDFGNGQTSGNAAGQTITYTTPGIYTITLVVQNDDGCASVSTRTLEVIPAEFGPIPEVITPNNDNYNDVFYINGIERYPNNELQIFNRWGNLVYEMKNYNNSWKGNSNVNGKTEGDKLPAGTYFILLQLNDSTGKVYKTYCQLMY